MSNTGNDPSFESAADATLAQLNQLFQVAMSKNSFSQDDLDNGPSGVSAWWADLTKNGARGAIANSLKRDQGFIAQLQGQLRTWAEAGQRDDGSSYSWERWADFAKTVGSDLQTQSDLAWDASMLGPLYDAAKQTATDVADDAGAVVSKVADAASFFSENLPAIGIGAGVLVAAYIAWRLFR